MHKRVILGLTILALLVAGASPAEAKRKKKTRKQQDVPALTKAGLPNVQAAGAIVVDLDSGDELYAKNSDDLRNIASTGKIFVAMVVRAKGLDLDGETVITEDDQKRARRGAKSRLLVGRRFKNRDLLAAMLVASDNRACTALGRAVGLDPDQLVAEMNKLARRLGLKKTKFTDPSGLNGNQSTPREMAVALRAALEDDVLAGMMSTIHLVVDAVDTGEPLGGKKKGKKKGYRVEYNNTNHSLRAGRYDVLGGKTGYTDEARYCLVIAAKIDGKRFGMVFLGAEGELTRFADFARVAGWIDDDGPTKHPAKGGKGIGALADPPPAAITPRLAR